MRTSQDIRAEIAKLKRELRKTEAMERPSQRKRAKAVRTLIARKDGHSQHYYVKRTKAWRRKHERTPKGWKRKEKGAAPPPTPPPSEMVKWRVQVTTVDYNEAGGKPKGKCRHISTASVTVKAPKDATEEEIREEALSILMERAELESDKKIRLGIRRLLDTPEALIIGMERVK